MQVVKRYYPQGKKEKEMVKAYVNKFTFNCQCCNKEKNKRRQGVIFCIDCYFEKIALTKEAKEAFIKDISIDQLINLDFD